MRTDELFRQAFLESPIGMAILDDAGTYQEVNPTFASVVGLSTEQVAGRSYEEFTHPDDRQTSRETLARVRSGDAPSAQIIKRYLSNEGEIVWARVTVSDARTATEDPSRRLLVQVEDITEERRAKTLLAHRTHYDPLTGLANRPLLLEKLAHALRTHRESASTVACVFLDIDHFKVVNDSLGHDAGDNLLKEIARRIQDNTRAGDTVARLGGDEFVIVLEDVPDRAAAERAVASVVKVVQTAVRIEGHELVPTASIGLALAERESTAEQLLMAADTALSAAKRGGRARVTTYDPRMRTDAMSKLSVELELRTAIKEGHLEVHYQPIVDLQTRRIVNFEALVRWRHPSRGLLQPDTFIGVAEEANLIVPLGAYVIREACHFIAWHPEFTGRILVNVSTKQIGAADLTGVVRSALAETGVDPSRVGLEITETGMLMATPAAKSDIASLTALGIDLVIDDFGTGYSSLSSVLLNPVSGLKLAREFTLRLGDLATGDRISLAMAALTRSLQMYGVIEGIETEVQYAIARRHGWTYGQGFLFGHPVPADRIRFDDDGTARIPVEKKPVNAAPERQRLWTEAPESPAASDSTASPLQRLRPDIDEEILIRAAESRF
ncbi:bifunctional diguanylate cyclase/phosphodiesterase [Demequina sp. NBRC 110054]|uniref:putative bifunctional diguanylate cyclase/phosphodiesterase n=1 Tax=Demequina sp. NBRC 110054 TaxID=1570343 RepID=UPI00135643A2|nr:EAL domain-containing protein [Demequina sp. NBRC 110054]